MNRLVHVQVERLTDHNAYKNDGTLVDPTYCEQIGGREEDTMFSFLVMENVSKT